MQSKRRDGPFYHLGALLRWLGAAAGRNPKAVQWLLTGLLSSLVGGGTAVGLSQSGPARKVSAIDRQWLVDSFPAYLRPTVRKVVQEENLPVFAKLDTMEAKNLEVRRFIVSTAAYHRWKVARMRRLAEEERIESEAERGFSPRELSRRPGRHFERGGEESEIE
ncbi:MAG: hypothetical protein K0Q91_1011 [Fibrobacteria bacterium]|jgi:hypothetical protein|nr:hypothetical protein [Fibrobacteria bacterium]